MLMSIVNEKGFWQRKAASPQGAVCQRKKTKTKLSDFQVCRRYKEDDCRAIVNYARHHLTP